MTDTIARKLELDAAPAEVWRTLTDPGELSRWFGDTADFEARAGFEGWFGWEEHGRFAVRVVKADPPGHLAWRWTHQRDSPFDEAASTLVEWTLTPRDDGGTTLELRESGFQTERHFRENTEGWSAELSELTKLLEAAA